MKKFFRKLKFFYFNLGYYGPYKTFTHTFRYLIFFCAKNIFNKKTIVRKLHGYKMMLSLTNLGVSKLLYQYGCHEEDHLYCFTKVLKPGDCTLDIGANLGYFALMQANLVGSTGQVYAIEPDQRNSEILEKNIILNNFSDYVETFDCAMSNENSIKEFAIQPHTNLNFIVPNATDSPAYAAYFKQNLTKKKVKTINITDFLKEHQKINLMRMDIEGHEIEILEGIIEFVEQDKRKAPDYILFEAHPTLYNKTTRNLKQKLARLFEHGYNVLTITTFDEVFAKPIKALGYKPIHYTYSNSHKRGIYSNIKNSDAITLICDAGCVRAILLSRITNDIIANVQVMPD
jgi:FkbM family methyltransferase